MSICLKCGKKIRGGDKIKVKGVWMHHHTSIRKPVKAHVKMKSGRTNWLSLSIKNKNLSDEQLISRMVESRL